MARSEILLEFASFTSTAWVLLFLLVSSLTAFWFYQSKCWEAWRLFECASGRKRFKQFIANRIPESITGIHGGFHGFFKGEIRVFFHFRDCIEAELFLGKWSESAGSHVGILQVLFQTQLKISKAYVTKNSEWLLVDDSQKTALLYVPFWFTVDDIPI